MNTSQEISPAPHVRVGEEVVQPNSLTPGVMVFFMTICFLVIFGTRR